jgi:hypothetical protein
MQKFKLYQLLDYNTYLSSSKFEVLVVKSSMPNYASKQIKPIIDLILK